MLCKLQHKITVKLTLEKRFVVDSRKSECLMCGELVKTEFSRSEKEMCFIQIEFIV